MKSRSALTGAAGLLLGLAAMAAYQNHASKAAQAPRPAVIETRASNILKPDAQPDAPLPDELYRFALNVFLVPLLDDSNPPRWSDAALDFSCEAGTTVLVDGAPLVHAIPRIRKQRRRDARSTLMHPETRPPAA